MSKMGKIISAPAKLPNILATPRPPMQISPRAKRHRARHQKVRCHLLGSTSGGSLWVAVLAQM